MQPYATPCRFVLAPLVMPNLDLHDLTHAVVRIVAPQSLAVDHDGFTADEQRADQTLLPLLAPGDLILVSTPGALYRFARTLTKHQYDHIAAVVDDTHALHVGPYKVRLLPTARFLTQSRTPLVLRPVLTDDERAAFLAKLKSFIGRDYNLLQVFELIARLTLQRHFGIRLPSISQDADQTRALICSQALMQALAQSSATFGAYLRESGLPADQGAFGSASIHDFIRIHRERPDLLQKVVLPDCSTTEEADDAIDPADADVWNSATFLIRAALIRFVPDVFRDRARHALSQLESSATLAALPIPVPTFLYFIILVAIIRKYPLPALLALLPMLQQDKLSPRSSL